MGKTKLLRAAITYEGKRYYVSGYTKTEVEVNKALRRRELEKGTVVINGNITVKEWAHRWLATYKEPVVNPSWYKALNGMLNNHILPVIGSVRVKSIRPTNLQDVLNKCTHLSDATMKIIKNIMGEMFERAVYDNLIPTNPSRGLISPKAQPPMERRSITPKEREHILKVAQAHWGGLFILCMLCCGLRPGEVAALQWKHVDLKKKNINIRQAVKSDGSIGPPKSNAGIRTVPIPDNLLPYLKKGEPFSYVCPAKEGGQHTRKSIQRLWHGFKRALNISMGCKTFKGKVVPPYAVADDLVMYCLRHTYCTDLQAVGVPINVARELMGHSSISITSKIYTHHSEESFEDARAKINGQNVATGVAPTSISIEK